MELLEDGAVVLVVLDVVGDLLEPLVLVVVG